MYKKYIKRLIDIILSLLALIMLSPLLLIISILVRIKLGRPVIFKQKRPGLNEKIFTLYKFRTMTDARDDSGNLLPDSVRLTKFGVFLRKTSLDEIPELINILKGDMSFVGPRPQLVKDMVFMTSEQRMRHMVKPGLTGLAQVNGRNRISWEEKLNYDLQYIAKISLIYDIKIILKTFLIVIKKDGITSEGMQTSEDLGDYLLRLGKINIDTYNSSLEICKNLIEKCNL